ncbi:C40 family peptidase [Paradesulfitobacterium ferrireducens]|uniref:C40 family peptidase n=1 Tax=Paradesulfitobacterium ferrireducens TaxID=2816476 RepID=UPI001A90642F|nr:C40 family peptidase [Paradesulfitobacterium ferrireducens]
MQAALPIGSPVALNVYGVTAALLIGIAIMPVQKPFETYPIPIPNTPDNTVESVSIAELQTKPMLELPPKEITPAEEPGVSRQELIEYARTWIGVPYLWGGESRTGIDCSALVQTVYVNYGITLPRTAKEQFREGEGVALTNLLPGDLVFFSTNGPGASHVGIYLGDGEFVSATRRQVEIQNLSQAYWRKAYRGSRRILP